MYLKKLLKYTSGVKPLRLIIVLKKYIMKENKIKNYYMKSLR